MDEMTLTLHNPLAEEEWDLIENVDFDHTNSITFHTKHGKDVVFVKRKAGRWIGKPLGGLCTVRCSCCRNVFLQNDGRWKFCPDCGADMRGDNNG